MVSGRCTTRLENTHGTEIRELLYPWHPWFALWVAVHEAIDKSDGVVFRCGLTGSDAGRWLEVPAWMFDRSACAGTRIATDAHADLAALTMLATLLRHSLNEHFASSNAPFSGASRLSHDQNRGEVYAAPDDTDASAPPRAATTRPAFGRKISGRCAAPICPIIMIKKRELLSPLLGYSLSRSQWPQSLRPECRGKLLLKA